MAKPFVFKRTTQGPTIDVWADVRAELEKAKQESQPVSKKGSGDQSWLSSIISELSGAGGAAGGAAAGAALGSVVPGIGNIVGGIGGGILGGFLGGTGGRLVENQVRDNEMRLADALKEGFWSGAFGAIGPAWQGARGAYAAGKAAGYGGQGLINTMKAGSGLIDDAVIAAGKTGGKTAAARTGMQVMKSGAKSGKAIGQGLTTIDDISAVSRRGLLGAGDKMRNYNRGITVGNKGLKPGDAQKYGKALDDVNKWFSGIGKSQQFANADDAMRALSNQYKISGEGARAFKNADDVLKLFKKELASNPSLKGQISSGASKTLRQNLEKATRGFKNNDDFLKYISENINPRYRDLVSKTGSMGSKETQIYEAFRRATKQVIDEKLPSKSGINKQFANLIGASDELGQTITRDAAAGASQGLSPGRIGQNILGPGADILGRGAQQLGKVTQYTTPIAKGATLRGALMDSGPAPEQPVEGEQVDPLQQEIQAIQAGMINQGGLSTAMGGIIDNQMTNAMVGAGQLPMNQAELYPQQSNNQFSPQNMQASVQQILAQGGDFDDVKKYLSIVEVMQELSGEMGGGQPELTAIQRNKIAGFNTAGQVVNQLEQLWQGVNQPGSQALAGLTGLPGVKQARSTFDPNVRQYTQFAEGTLAPIIKSLGETGVLTDRDIIRAYGLVPNLQDSPDVASNKIMQLRQLLQNAESATADGSYGVSNPLEEAISQYQLY